MAAIPNGYKNGWEALPPRLILVNVCLHFKFIIPIKLNKNKKHNIVNIMGNSNDKNS